MAEVEDAATLCAELGHEVVEYWASKLGREPDPPELEPHTRAWPDEERKIPAADYLLAKQNLQVLRRTVARFSTEVDVWLTPTLAAPGLPTGGSTDKGSADTSDLRGFNRPHAPAGVRNRRGFFLNALSCLATSI